MRITSGRFKGRRLLSPKGAVARPTKEQVRQALFNQIRAKVQDARFLDLFAGSGAMGFEALSEGAEHVTFVERDRQCRETILQNCAVLGVKENITLLPMEAKRALALLKGQDCFSLLYLDPPYADPIDDLAPLLHEVAAPEALLFVEHGEQRECPLSGSPFFCPTGRKQYGQTVVDSFLHKKTYRMKRRTCK